MQTKVRGLREDLEGDRNKNGKYGEIYGGEEVNNIVFVRRLCRSIGNRIKIKRMKEETYKKYCLVIDEWFVNGWNGAQAYWKYYPKATENTADKGFRDIHGNPRIQEYIKKKYQEIQEKIEVTHDDLLSRLKLWVDSDITSTLLLSANEIKELPKEIRQLITEYTCDVVVVDGKEVAKKIKLKFISKEKAADMIAKHIGFYGEHNKQKKPEAGRVKLVFKDGIERDDD